MPKHSHISLCVSCANYLLMLPIVFFKRFMFLLSFIVVLLAVNVDLMQLPIVHGNRDESYRD